MFPLWAVEMSRVSKPVGALCEEHGWRRLHEESLSLPVRFRQSPGQRALWATQGRAMCRCHQTGGAQTSPHPTPVRSHRGSLGLTSSHQGPFLRRQLGRSAPATRGGPATLWPLLFHGAFSSLEPQFHPLRPSERSPWETLSFSLMSGRQMEVSGRSGSPGDQRGLSLEGRKGQAGSSSDLPKSGHPSGIYTVSPGGLSWTEASSPRESKVGPFPK